MAYPTIFVEGLRKAPFNPDKPQNRIILFENDHRHPGGQASIEEGKVSEVYKTKTVNKLGSRVRVLTAEQAAAKGVERAEVQRRVSEAKSEGDDEAALLAAAELQEEANKSIDPESLHNLDLGDDSVRALSELGVETIGRVLEAHQSGDLKVADGIGPDRFSEIEAALVKAGHLEDPGNDDD